MTHDQAVIAVPLLNSYAHQYLGLSVDNVMIAGGRREGVWLLMVATDTGVEEAPDFDAAKAMIDSLRRMVSRNTPHLDEFRDK